MEANLEQQQLEEMREKMAILRRKIDSQALINEQLMRRVMADRLSFVDYSKIVGIVLNVFVIIFLNYMFTEVIKVSWQLTLYTTLMLLFAIIWDIYNYNVVKSSYLLSENLRVVYDRIQRQKRLNRRYKCIAYPLLVVFFTWFAVEVYQLSGGEYAMSAGAIVGGVIGGLIGGFLMHRYNRILKDTQDQIEKFTEE